MGFAILSKNQYVATHLPPWSGGSPAQVADFITAIRRHSPLCVFPMARNDADYCSVPVAVLEAAIRHTLQSLDKQGIKYRKNAFDCEDFVNELHQTLRKMAAKAGVERSPISCMIRVMLTYDFANVKPGGAHALACIQTDAGPFVVESQNGLKCPIEEYPNRAAIFDASNL